MRAVEILTTAAQLVGGDRAKTHGDKYVNHGMIARLWNAYLENAGVCLVGDDMGASQRLDPTDVANMMILLKIARTQSGGTHNDDNYIDAAGYAGVAGECARVDRVKD
jgi:hypothetical protein